MNELRDFLGVFANALLLIAFPILIGYVIWWLRSRIDELKQDFNGDQLKIIESVGSLAVRAAEQAGLTGVLHGGSAKKSYAVEAAQRYFDRLDIKIDVESIAALVEAEVIRNFSSSAPPADTPGARAELVEKAVQAAVLAAEQSGLKQLAVKAGVELADQKKDYAMNLAQQHLKDHGIKVDLSLVDGLIEAQILRFKMEAAGYQF